MSIRRRRRPTRYLSVWRMIGNVSFSGNKSEQNGQVTA
jgi:hypothetical protein